MTENRSKDVNKRPNEKFEFWVLSSVIRAFLFVSTIRTPLLSAAVALFQTISPNSSQKVQKIGFKMINELLIPFDETDTYEANLIPTTAVNTIRRLPHSKRYCGKRVGENGYRSNKPYSWCSSNTRDVSCHVSLRVFQQQFGRPDLPTYSIRRSTEYAENCSLTVKYRSHRFRRHIEIPRNSLLSVQFKVCRGSLYAVMWLADEPREFNLPTLPQRRITYVPEKLPASTAFIMKSTYRYVRSNVCFILQLSQYADIVYVYGLCNGSSLRAVTEYERSFPNRRVPYRRVLTVYGVRKSDLDTVPDVRMKGAQRICGDLVSRS
ncbi:hypothetical protein ANN_27163 [Periplaneta americana]|uniref:DUF4817 domain-containing protein n=1 Tax=Periplaneta americana TaxID=6978 RepID=A0ABQ8RXG8_PERAM|nr:hypothetical protein ANN_27163 [Periplaneta americana]